MPMPTCTNRPLPLAARLAPIAAKLMLPDSAYSSAIPNNRKAEPAADSTMYLIPASSERLLKKA
ncbi:hypothetical protein D3C86_1923650 [compost metagenome]